MFEPLMARLRRWRGERLAARSGLFDPAFYARQLVGRDDEARARKAPWRHYLRHGAFEGLDPGPDFDSDWYLARNRDVQSAGLNPLVHYVQHGRAEGRLPYHGAPVPWLAEAPGLDAKALRVQRLWGGFEHLELPELTRLAAQQNDLDAAWHLAAWRYAQGDTGGALKCLLPLVSGKRSPSQQDLVGLTKCYSLDANNTAIAALLERPGARSVLAEALPFVSANAQSTDQARLCEINRLLAEAGLSGIGVREAARPLALNNLTSVSAVPYEYNNPPLISIVMAAYNAEQTVSIALDSVLAQSWKHLELIVVDDASTDGTAAVIQSYAERDPRVRYIRNETNSGAYPSRNTGMRAARGDFVTVHDSDDWSHSQKLERQILPLLESPVLVATVSSWARVTPQLRFVGSWMLGESFLETNHSSWLIRRSVLDAIGYWDNVNVAADTEFLWRMEHHYGHRALEHVLYSTPLSFALSDDATLTRTKATHVKTVFYGLRRLYRESSRWWHRCSDYRPVMSDTRPFPVPLANLKQPPREYDELVAANCAVEGAQLDRLLSVLEERVAAGKRLCVLHWPDYRAWLGNPIADRVFAFCQQQGVDFAHQGLMLTVPTVILTEPALWRYPPSQTVKIENLEQVILPDGQACQEQYALRAYFARGGVEQAL